MTPAERTLLLACARLLCVRPGYLPLCDVEVLRDDVQRALDALEAADGAVGDCPALALLRPETGVVVIERAMRALGRGESPIARVTKGELT